MSLISALPKEGRQWYNFFEKFYSKIDDVLHLIVFSSNKCSLIASQLADFHEKLPRIFDLKLSSLDISRLFSYSRACVAFIGMIYNFRSTTWLSYFLDNDLDKPYNDLSTLWDIWYSAAQSLCFTSFENKSALYYAHAKDLIDTHIVLSQSLDTLTAKIQPLIIKKLETIQFLLRTSPPITDAVNQSILQHCDWEILKENIGRGGFATVHLARLKSTGEDVAVKELKAVQLTYRAMVNLKREISTMLQVHHRNLLRLIGVTVTPPFCLVSHFLPNGSLYDLLHVTPEKATPLIRSRVALDVARAVEYLHAMGMVHRDLKPPNVLMDSDYRAVVCDFGLSRYVAPEMTSCVGTINWLAPEQIIKGNKYDQSVDVYAYGMILNELASSEVPFKTLRAVQIAISVLNDDLRPDIAEGINEGLVNIIKKSWSRDPNQRPTMSQIRRDLETGDFVFPGCDKDEYLKFVRETAKEHSDSMELLMHSKSDAGQISQRLTQIKEGDPNAIGILQQILDARLRGKEVIGGVLRFASQSQSEEAKNIARKIIEQMYDAGEIRDEIEELWEKDEEFVVKLIKRRKSENMVGLFLSIKQTERTVDILEFLMEKKDVDAVFSRLNDSIAEKVLKNSIAKFGVSKSMASAAMVSFDALTCFLTASGSSDEAEKLLEGQKFRNSKEDLWRLIELLWPMVQQTKVGFVSLELLRLGSKTVPEKVQQLNLAPLISESFASGRSDLVSPTVEILRNLPPSEEFIRKIWPSFVKNGSIMKDEGMRALLVDFMDKLPDLDVSKVVDAAFSDIQPEYAASSKIVQMLLSLNIESHKCHLSKYFAQIFNEQMLKCDFNVVIAGFLFITKYLRAKGDKEVPMEILAASLNFLYTRRPPFSVAEVAISFVLEIAKGKEFAVFLAKNNFVTYLHQIPLVYPGNPKVLEFIAQFAVAFDRAASPN